MQWDPTGGSNFVDIPNSAFVEPDNDLIKTGAGTLTLSNNNTYSGPTIVDAGELVVNGSVLDSAITVNSGGTLGGDGRLPATTLESGGFFSPGDSPGTITASKFIPGERRHVHGTVGRHIRWITVRPDHHTRRRLRRPWRRDPEHLIFGRLPAHASASNSP